MNLWRLNRNEYANVLHDLLGVTYIPTDPGNLPEDPDWHGFDHLGPVLSLARSHMEPYLAATGCPGGIVQRWSTEC